MLDALFLKCQLCKFHKDLKVKWLWSLNDNTRNKDFTILLTGGFLFLFFFNFEPKYSSIFSMAVLDIKGKLEQNTVKSFTLINRFNRKELVKMENILIEIKDVV